MADDPDKALAAAIKAQQKEWSTYVATGPIDINGVRAFNAGHAVPASHVERGIVDKSQVRKASDGEATAAIAPLLTEVPSSPAIPPLSPPAS